MFNIARNIAGNIAGKGVVAQCGWVSNTVASNIARCGCPLILLNQKQLPLLTPELKPKFKFVIHVALVFNKHQIEWSNLFQ